MERDELRAAAQRVYDSGAKGDGALMEKLYQGIPGDLTEDEIRGILCFLVGWHHDTYRGNENFWTGVASAVLAQVKTEEKNG